MYTVVFIGRTNVGKSTLFNKLSNKKKALVSNISGTTRDKNIDTATWRGKTFKIIDTGGLDIAYLPQEKTTKDILKKIRGRKKLKKLEEDIIFQAQESLKKADLILFLIDGKIGILPEDRTIINYLRKNEKQFLLVANKIDNQIYRNEAYQLLKLGMGAPLLISARTGVGIGDLLDEIVKLINKQPGEINEENNEVEENEIKETDKEKEKLKLAIIGKPNVGKSSLVNAILGRQEMIVSEIPHTTRESHDSTFEYQGRIFTFVDTAGILKSAQKGKDKLTKLGIERSFASMKKSDVILFMLDISEPLTKQDSLIGEEIVSRRKGAIILANKWDLINNKQHNTEKLAKENIYHSLPHMDWAPILFISAKTKEKTQKIFNLILKVEENQKKFIDNATLEKFLKTAIKKHRPVKGKGVRHPYIVDFQQEKTNPPTFILTIRGETKDSLHSSYVRFLENRLREQFALLGASVNIILKVVH